MVNSLRPDWPIKSLVTFLETRLHMRAYRDAAVALAWIASDASTTTPARVLEAGPWWPGSIDGGTYRPPRNDEACQLHGGGYKHSCPGCAADAKTGEVTRRDERTSRGSEHAQAIRNERGWAKGKAS